MVKFDQKYVVDLLVVTSLKGTRYPLTTYATVDAQKRSSCLCPHALHITATTRKIL